MKSVRSWAALASVGLVASTIGVAGGIPAAGASTSTARTPLAGSMSPEVQRTKAQGEVPAATPVSFQVSLQMTNATGAQSEVRAVSDPASSSFHHYLTDAEWESDYGPTQAEVSSASTWLTQQGFTVGAVPSDRMFVTAEGTAAQVEKTFDTSLSYYVVNGKTVRLADSTLSVPSSIAGTVSGVVGVNEYLATNRLAEEGQEAASAAAAQPDQEPPPPPGFVNARPCSAYWGEKTDTTDAASLYAPYTSPLPYDICGYSPSQLRSAYGLHPGAVDGTGVGIAIVDAYESPTLLSDAQEYFSINDPTHRLLSSQFFTSPPPTVDDQSECDGSGWYDEQALDVEASHSMAPGADILFVGAQDCQDTSLLAALETAITSGASVVSDSWGDDLGDLLDDASTKTAYDDAFMLADATGVSVLFSSGDSGDNFADFGIAAPDYPPSSPFVTAVGGTSLEIGSTGAREQEYGWSTAKQVLCTPPTTTNCGSATTPTGALAFQAGGGGGTSYYYTQPYYQADVVPSALALRNEALFGPTPLRVEPDIAMDADAQTGMLIGLTQIFPNGTYYAQFKEGGTSLASPLLAGSIADADEAAGMSLGFLNPTLYKAYSDGYGAFTDVTAPADPDSAAVIRIDYENDLDASEGYEVSLRTLNYTGPETYCDGTGNCATRDVTLTATPGFDAITGVGSAGAHFIADLAKF